MAASEVNLVLKVSADGLKGLVEQAAQFNKNMQSGAAAGGTAGSKSVASKADYAASIAERNLGRSIGQGSTGSATSDFAKQASGLGGLVHVYATFAANIFAVSTAFSTLSKAMDNTNLVSGLDQIGAASGKNLGSVAKQMVAVADGAISMRDAMTSTAMASSGGISNANILRMTEVAKKASLALGRDLPDSMDRLTKGIVKVQPELLDELGIMTRVIPAQQEYARQMGKSVSALTDFEKRQAFANAVLAEGEKKFGNINLQANPYSKLLASSTNLLQSGLEVINKVLTPLVSFLASSPTGLALAIGGIAAMLLKQAIPALGAWREGLHNAAVEAEKTANRINSKFTDFDVARKLGPAQALSEAATQEANAAIANVQTSLSKAFSSNSKIVKSVAGATYDADAVQKSIDTQVKASTTKLATLEEAKRITASTDTAHLDALDKAIAKQKEQLNYVKAASAENIIAGQKMAASQKILDDAEANVGAPPSRGSEAWQREQIAKRASARAQASAILSNVGSNTETMGTREAFKSLFSDVKNGAERFDEAGNSIGKYTDKLTGLTKYTTLAKGSFSILTSTISTALNAFSPWIAAIGLAVTALTMFDEWASSNSKQLGIYSTTIDNLVGSFDNVDRTLSSISNKNPLDRLSISSTQAVANAFKELSDSIAAVSTSFIDVQNKAGTFDKIKESIKGAFGFGANNEMAESLSKSIGKTLDLIGSGDSATEFKSKISKLLGTDKFDIKSLQESFNKLTDSGKIKLLNDFVKIEEEVSNKSNNAASNLTVFKDALTATTKASQDLTNSFNLNDPAAKLGSTLIAVSSALQKVVSSGEDSQKALIELLNNTEALSAIGTDYAISLVSIRKEFLNNSAAAKDYADSIDKVKASYADALSKKQTISPQNGRALSSDELAFNTSENRGSAGQATENAAENLRILNKGIQAAQTNAKSLQIQAQKILADGMYESFKRGTDLIDKSLGLGAEKVANSIARGYSVGLTGTQALDQQKMIAQKDASIQLRLIDVNSEQILATNKLASVMEGIALADKQAQELAKPKDQQNPAILAQLEKSIKINAGVQEALGTQSGLSSTQVSKNVVDSVTAARRKGVDPDSVEAGIGRSLEGQYAAQKGIAIKKAEAAAALKELEISQLYSKTVAEYTQNTQTKLTYEKDILGLQVSSLATADKLNGFITSDSLAAKQALDLEIQKKESLLAEGNIKAQISGIDAQLTTEMSSQQATNLLNQKSVLQISLTRQRELDIQKELNLRGLEAVDLLLLQQQNQRNLNKLKMGPGITAAEQALSIAQDDIDAQQELLDLAKERGRITEDNYTSKTKELKLSTAEVTRDKSFNSLAVAHVEKMATLTDNLNNAKKGGSKEALDMANAEMDAEAASYAAAISGADRVYKAEKRRLDLTTQQVAAEKALEDGINSAADTLVGSFLDATQTGKYEFSNMINSMLIDLAKLELKMALMDAWKGTGAAGGLSSLFGNIFSGGNSNASGAAAANMTPSQANDFAASLAPYANAKGGAYDLGIQAFAKGGAFTNTVVDSPTTFKFAKGTGLMGEAGPEAIMPLKRDASGRLGVANHDGGSGSTQVVINNYSGQPVDSKQTVDSRGNRRTEVTIGNMVAGEISRPGSMAQQSIKSTFGTKTALIRR